VLEAREADGSIVTFEHHYNDVRAYLKRYADWVEQRSTHDFDDAHQELLIRAWEAHKRYDPTRGTTFASYCFFWIRSKAVEMVRRDARRSRNLTLLPLDQKASAPDRLLETAESRVWVEQICRQARRKMGGVVLPLRVLGLIESGLTATEAGKALNLTRDHLYRTMSRVVRPVVRKLV
jgi:RNA polymerase sigma factor (sigma-70 family)